MRRGWGICATLLLAACIPSGRSGKPAPQTRAELGPVGEPTKETLQCYADLRRDDVGFRPLADRYFGNGCTALGSVQLLDIGTPVTNLKAMTCPEARQFGRWVREAVQPAANAWLGGRIVRIESFGSYSCRPLNGQAGQRLSEHGRANAVDISAFVVQGGRHHRRGLERRGQGRSAIPSRGSRRRLPPVPGGARPGRQRLSPRPSSSRHGQWALLPLSEIARRPTVARRMPCLHACGP